MTDIEAKALALVNAYAINRRSDLDDAKHTELRCALLDAVQSQAATEARHAAELRELKERFSEVVTDWFGRYSAEVPPQFQPFILPAPDPLVEAIRSALPKALVAHDTYDANVMDVAAAVRKIGEAGE